MLDPGKHCFCVKYNSSKDIQDNEKAKRISFLLQICKTIETTTQVPRTRNVWQSYRRLCFLKWV